jgi:hypothetical protein
MYFKTLRAVVRLSKTVTTTPEERVRVTGSLGWAGAGIRAPEES